MRWTDQGKQDLLGFISSQKRGVRHSRGLSSASKIEISRVDSPPAGLTDNQLCSFYDERGERRYNRGNYEGALADFKNALKFFPDLPVYHIWIAKAANKLGRKDEASIHKLWAKRLNERNINRDFDTWNHYCEVCRKAYGREIDL